MFNAKLFINLSLNLSATVYPLIYLVYLPVYTYQSTYLSVVSRADMEHYWAKIESRNGRKLRREAKDEAKGKERSDTNT